MINRIHLLTLAMGWSSLSFAATDVETLQNEVEQLKAQNKTILERLNATSEIVEKQTGQASNLHIGGYGELHYNNLENRKPGGSDKKEIDFHRFVLFFGYDFTDAIRFHSEVELEHALIDDTNKGEYELEQAYIEFDLNKNSALKAGLFLVPVGIINETHEPPSFYGVERNPVESNIIPATWWEAGAAYTRRFDNGMSMDIAAHSGLKTSGPNYKIRDGRQKVAKADASDPAYTLRVRYTGINGLELATTLQRQTNITQGADATAGAATLIAAHGVWQHGPYNLRALYANWNLDGSGPAATGANKQTGWYIEPAYRLNTRWGMFARYNQWDNAAGDATDSKYSQVDVGVNYWPHPDVVVKVNYQDQTVPAGQNEFDGVNVGIGYQF